MPKKLELSEFELLCRWLNARNKLESDLFFTKYYRKVEQILYPHIERELGVSKSSLAADIFQETMIKMLKQINERPQSEKCIEELMEELQAFDIKDPFFEKRVITWGDNVNLWKKEVMIFFHEHRDTKSPELDDKAKELNNKMTPLGGEDVEGKALLDWLSNNQINIPHGTEFSKKIKIIIELLPKIRIPTSALLYTIATNKVKDHWKKNQLSLKPHLKLIGGMKMKIVIAE
jgi:hypothetical protein